MNDTIGVWKTDTISENEASHEHIARTPISFTLPCSQAPTGRFGKENSVFHTWPAFVNGYVEAIGIYSDKRQVAKIIRPFMYVPPNEAGARLSKTLDSEWMGGWRTVEGTQTIRRGLPWRAHVQAQASITVSAFVHTIIIPVAEQGYLVVVSGNGGFPYPNIYTFQFEHRNRDNWRQQGVPFSAVMADLRSPRL